MSQERVALIRSLGAKIVPVSREQGGFLGSIRMTEECAQHEPHVFLPAQFANEANVEAHEQTTGPEIWWQLHFHKIKPDAFVAGVGTGGTIMGAGKFLRPQNPAIKLHPLNPPNRRHFHRWAQSWPAPHPGHVGRVHSGDSASWKSLIKWSAFMMAMRF